MKSFIASLVIASRWIKLCGLMLLDFLVFPILLWVCYALRLLDLSADLVPNLYLGEFWISLFAVACLFVCSVYHFVIRTFNETLIVRLFIATIMTVIGLLLLGHFSDVFIPASVAFMFGFMMFLWVWLSRSAIRLTVRYILNPRVTSKRIAIYGAGIGGQQVVQTLLRSDEHLPLFFIDDDKNLRNRRVGGLKIYSAKAALDALERYEIDEILIALPSISRARKNEIVEFLSQSHRRIMELPSLTKLVDGQINISDIKEVDIVDLLGREPVDPVPELFSKNIQGKVVMVTGAGGSIGSELCRQIIRNQPNTLLLFEISEYALYAIEQDLKNIIREESLPEMKILPLLGNVQNKQRLVEIMKAFNVETLYHAAAYKHVPMVEYNVVEGVQNNIFGTYNTAKAAIEANVDSFVLISTDKAVRPTNVMGTTKRIAELCLQALAQEQGKTHHTLFSMVRFGNVLGSSGSVIPLFKKQIAHGGPITVTDKRIIRYFMTIPEAAQLVIQAGAMAKGGDVFILDMGEPVKIVDLARNLVKLSGLTIKDESNPDGDIEIRFTGLRPGEKLYEELLIGGDNVEQTYHERIMTAKEDFLPPGKLKELIKQLEDACNHNDCEQVRHLLLNAPTGYHPVSELADFVWNKQHSDD
ncbi:polysaccharide biosynthesis protein [Exercitatus varius]|uniref:polysaccharide biosynthesis protein n=1 Tax=Exercitatus varius TaxID=67857 RepID=UPI00294AA5B1|nr:nucleoside-diphosphate sugar epimerase/dehydratase [Exercitatus varius]MDG2942031.1 nucleoside-diphosphate sugar epimerase/dehydratase [Exercitatus varius]